MIQTFNELAPLNALLRRERKRFVSYWTVLQEMRIRGELPDWVQKNFASIGEHADYDDQHSDQQETDRALRGEPVLSKYSIGLDSRNTLFVHRFDGSLLFEGRPSEMPARHQDVLFELTPSQLQMYVNALRVETLGMEAAYA